MNAADFQAWSDAVLNRVESALSDWVPAAAPAGLGEAMRYGVLDGGNRLRALLVQVRPRPRVPALTRWAPRRPCVRPRRWS